MTITLNHLVAPGDTLGSVRAKFKGIVDGIIQPHGFDKINAVEGIDLYVDAYRVGPSGNIEDILIHNGFTVGDRIVLTYGCRLKSRAACT